MYQLTPTELQTAYLDTFNKIPTNAVFGGGNWKPAQFIHYRLSNKVSKLEWL